MTKGIEGFTALQKDLADRIWSLDTELEVSAFIMSLPKNLRREAYVVMQMIIAAELDNVMEVSDDVKNYCHSL